jgi:hypothetical protein
VVEEEKLTPYMTARDLAVYALVTALDSYNRKELKKLLQNTKFKSFLENFPDINNIIENFLHGEYDKFFNTLRIFETSLAYDLYLG